MSEIELLAFDMDNTLLNPEKQLSPRTTRVLKQLHQAGKHIVLCTGRPFPNVAPFINELELNHPDDFVVLFNGGCVKNIVSDANLFDAHFDLADVQDMFAFIHDQQLPIDLVAQNEVISIQDYGQSPYHELLNKRMPYQQIALANLPADLNFNKFVVAAPEATLDQFIQLLPAHPELTQTMDHVRSRRNLLEFVPKGVNKASGLQKLLDHFNLDAQQLMVFGDEENDAPMFKLAGTSVAMGNAIPEIKALATDVTASNAQDGVALFLENYFA
ncbi:Cof subfamily protein (haloacid dehalogenase superfamily) [Weissella uvarum]|uniref:Cof-type HAD-IIB family hydrolase n=1 Tax=Weissella uvarum TaxID=1479233 RepID=UPI0019607AA1|nr:Cof-type HAD-IIB family hydrolase [Weissella uvarum]MBM7616561.1 Cof subfamily protein (haloacid dehalogenase superfamily) [Weissella uvarum]MCM0594979.1 HAD family phosphatase [Weissella uvarum]